MNEKVNKPWGWYKVLTKGKSYTTKELYINPGQRFSLQKHFKREEHWHILEGYGFLDHNGNTKIVSQNDYVFIGIQDIHRLEAGPEGLLFFELQSGICDEDDILRLEDDYHRK